MGKEKPYNYDLYLKSGFEDAEVFTFRAYPFVVLICDQIHGRKREAFEYIRLPMEVIGN